MFKTSRLERAGFAARRSVVMARNGMVATSQPLATEAGVAILKKGGNAFDAAIATALTLDVVEPMSTSIGSDAFLLYHWAADGKLYGVNGSGRCPQNLTLDALRRQGMQGIPRYGWGTVTVPGAIDAFVEVQRRHGKLTFAEVLEPAIYYASEGFPVSEIIAQQWQTAAPVLRQFPATAQNYLIDGQAPQAGDVHRQPNLARTLQQLAAEGKDAFYRGDIARRIVQFSQATGGFLTLDDLASHTTEWVEPLRTDYRGYSVLELPPNGQGITALMMLNVLTDLMWGRWHTAQRSITICSSRRPSRRSLIATATLLIPPMRLSRLLVCCRQRMRQPGDATSPWIAPVITCLGTRQRSAIPYT